ncbi:MAG: universal stress protein [Alphaproteobacteria bacterium]|nr:universal stress protein [Alphaproteobacteria bacterium]
MSIRSVLVPFFTSPKSDDALRVAASIAKRFAAHVHVVHGEVTDPEIFVHLEDPLMTTYQEELAQTLENRSQDYLREVMGQFDAAMKELDVPLVDAVNAAALPGVTWETCSDPEWEVIAMTGAVYDLVVVGGPAAHNEMAVVNLCAESALFRCGRPLLLTVPDAPVSVGARVLIGWNQSAQSGRAVTAAMPFLRSADAIRVVAIETGSKKGPSPEALAQNLGLHGVQAEIKKLTPDYRDVGEAILDEAKEFDADLVVMGAYSHSRLRELIFGGVTGHILTNADRPILMVH